MDTNKKILCVMAAGMGSRFGGIKQLEPVGTSGEVLLDYSVYDAKRAGFDKVVFIIKKEIEKDFKEIAGDRTDHSDKKDGRDALTKFRVTHSRQREKDREHRGSEDIAEGFIDSDGVFHKARDPVRHRVLGTASEEDASHAEGESDHVSLRSFAALRGLRGSHIGHRRYHKEHGGA